MIPGILVTVIPGILVMVIPGTLEAVILEGVILVIPVAEVVAVESA